VSEPARGERSPKPGRRPLSDIPCQNPISQVALARALCTKNNSYGIIFAQRARARREVASELANEQEAPLRLSPKKRGSYIPILKLFPARTLPTSFALPVNTIYRQCKACRKPIAPESAPPLHLRPAPSIFVENRETGLRCKGSADSVARQALHDRSRSCKVEKKDRAKKGPVSGVKVEHGSSACENREIAEKHPNLETPLKKRYRKAIAHRHR